MPRLPLLPGEPEDEVLGPVFDVFREEGRAPIALYRLLAHNPALLRSYSVLARSLRHDATTERSLRELVILRTAQLTGSEYEWAHHRAMAEKTGVAAAQIRELSRWEASNAFDERERAALRVAEEIHALAVTDDGFAGLRDQLGPAGAIEIALTAAFYQSVARVIQALGLELEPEYRPFAGEREPAGDVPNPAAGST
jgi:AhpD family alkylhydroperoxidase